MPEDDLFRRYFHYQVREDGKISSSAFKLKTGKPDPACSVYLQRLTTPHDVLGAGPAGMHVAILSASVPMGMGLDVVHMPVSPIVGTVDYAHSEIQGMSTKRQCSELADACEIAM